MEVCNVFLKYVHSKSSRMPSFSKNMCIIRVENCPPFPELCAQYPCIWMPCFSYAWCLCIWMPHFPMIHAHYQCIELTSSRSSHHVKCSDRSKSNLFLSFVWCIRWWLEQLSHLGYINLWGINTTFHFMTSSLKHTCRYRFEVLFDECFAAKISSWEIKPPCHLLAIRPTTLHAKTNKRLIYKQDTCTKKSS